MGVTSKASFSEISKSHYLFSTFNYFRLRKLIDEKPYFLKVRLGDFFEVISGFAFSSKDYTDEGVLVCRIGDISKTNELLVGEMLRLPEEYFEQYEKYRVQKDDILIGLTGDGKYFKTCLVEIDEPEILLNQRVGILRLKKGVSDIAIKFIAHLFNIDEVQNQIRIVAMGKTQKNVSPFDILNVKIPNVDYTKQNELLENIKPLETEIAELKNSKLQAVNIINQVFGEALEFDWSTFETIKREKTYTSSISKFANNIDCRMGIRFHNKAGAYIQAFLESKTNKKIKDYISEPIVLGSGVSPSDYDDDGEYFYIAMSNIKTWAFDPEDCKKVSESYAASNLNKTVKKGDILLARSGEGTIGKVALIEDEDINGIFADFTQRIRLTGFDPLCAYYYMRSDFFQYLVYTHKKGLGNNTNIFPSQIKEFPIPDWDETKQAEIVEKIKIQLDEQKVIDRQIEEKQQAINKIIEDAIKQEQN
jgi:restriction endonuclease S subunit